VLFDPQSADVQTDLAGLSTGGGIGVLATVAGVEPGDVDLIAPVGVVDAGDAGIRVSGNLNIAATAVLNASNIAVAGNSTGVPGAPVIAAPNIAGLASASTAAAGANQAASSLAAQNRQLPQPEETPSIISAQVIGYGGGDSNSEASAPSVDPQPSAAPTDAVPPDQNQKDDDDDDDSAPAPIGGKNAAL
jgi:hypothetical protein